jgi:tetratricopeptide (TPR) repeat protein
VNDVLERLTAAVADRYEVLGRAGDGGMAVVFRARDIHRDTDVAIKVYRPELSSSLTEARFLREVRISTDLDHPGIVPVLDSGSADGLLYFVMPFISGETLRERLDRTGPLSVDDALAITATVGDALAHAHRSGIVHRDVKPENIILGPDGWMIMDFSVARALTAAGGERLTHSGFHVGTPRYMSPEQCAGDSRIDVRADQYSLACVLFEMLLGEPPFTGPTAKAVIARHISETPPSLSVVRPNVPAGVEAAIHRALAKNAADRHPTVTDFIDELRRAPRVSRTSPFRRRRLIGMGAGALVLVAITSLATWGTRMDLDDRRVLVFPPLDGADQNGVNDQVANYIGYVLEGTAPLRWEEAHDWVGAGTRIADLSHADQVRLARRAGTRYFINGSIIRSIDSVTVIQRVYDARNGQLVSRDGKSSGPVTSEPRLAARAVANLLPSIIGPGLRVDLGALGERAPAAIANFYQGELAYRQTHFDQALRHYHAAVNTDSLFAIAAVKGVQAASWLEDAAAAAFLTDLALRHDSLLPVKYRSFLAGVRHYNAGQSDSAVYRLSETVAAYPEWAEGHFALGEVYYHLMPDLPALDSLARSAFLAAMRADPAFSPPLYHLAEMAIRRGDLVEARTLIGRLRAVSPGEPIGLQLELMIACAEGGPSSVPWAAHADTAARAVQAAAQAMSPAPALRACAEAAAEATLRPGTGWGAVLVLQSLLMADGRQDEIRALFASDRVSGIPVNYLLLLDAVVDPHLADAADSVYASLGPDFSKQSSPNLWLMLQWAAASGRPADVRAITEVLVQRASSGQRLDVLFADIARAREAAIEGDTDRALALLGELRPTGSVGDLVWNLWEPLVPERLLRAQLLLSRGSVTLARRLIDEPPSHRSVAELLFSPVRQQLLAEVPSARSH